MEIEVKSIKFDATDKLQEFIQKKVSKLDKFCDNIRKVEVSLKVVKPATAQNKEVSVTVKLPGEEIFVEKLSDTFEEAITQSLPAIERQLAKYKEKHYRNNTFDDNQLTLLDSIYIEKDNIKIEKISLKEGLKKLNKDELKLINLRYFKEMTQQETAKILNTNQVQVSRNESKILKKLKNSVC